MLSNIVLIITLILLIIILVLLYFFSNDIRKNKNKINILESDINAIRERLLSNNQKIISLENIVNSDFKKKNNQSFDNLGNPQNFADILEKLGSMNSDFFPDEMMNQDDNGIFINDEDDDEDDDDEEDDDEEDDDEDEEDEDDEEEDDEEEDEESYSEEESSEDDEDSNNLEKNENESIENKSISSKDASIQVKIEEVKEPLQEIVEEIVEPIKEKKIKNKENVEKELEEVKDNNSSNKLPKKSISKLDIGTVELGVDNKTKYIVQLNKANRKYWKKL